MDIELCLQRKRPAYWYLSLGLRIHPRQLLAQLPLWTRKQQPRDKEIVMVSKFTRSFPLWQARKPQVRKRHTTQCVSCYQKYHGTWLSSKVSLAFGSSSVLSPENVQASSCFWKREGQVSRHQVVRQASNHKNVICIFYHLKSKQNCDRTPFGYWT